MNKSKYFTRTGKDLLESPITEEIDVGPKQYVVEFTLLHTLRKRGIKQSELAKMAGLTNNAVTNIVRGYRERLSLEHVAKIATALQITDIREIMVLVEDSEAEFHSMYNSIKGEDKEDDDE